jgi:hypothetical protein
VHDYNFLVEQYKIPATHPGTELRRRLETFNKEFGRPTNLLIVYYKGHGRIENLSLREKSKWTQVGMLQGMYCSLQRIAAPASEWKPVENAAPDLFGRHHSAISLLLGSLTFCLS